MSRTVLENDLRERVFAAIVKERDRNPTFAAVMDQLGFFTACDFIDGVVAAIIAADVPGWRPTVEPSAGGE